jgi:hypothetical protein
MGKAAGGGSGSARAADQRTSGIAVTGAVSGQLRELRAADAEKARAVDAAIMRIPSGDGDPVRIPVPGAPPDREYRAILPASRDAPVVIYRAMEPGEGDGEGWVVTTLIDRDEYEQYMRAERNGILDAPAVKQVTEAVAGTVSSIVVNAVPGSVE